MIRKPFLILGVFFLFVLKGYPQSFENIDLEDRLLAHFNFDNNIEDEVGNFFLNNFDEFDFIANINKKDSMALFLKNQRLRANLVRPIDFPKYSISFWFKTAIDLTTNPKNKEVRFFQANSETNELSCSLYYLNGELFFEYTYYDADKPGYKLSSEKKFISANFLKDDWYFIAISYDETDHVLLTIDNTQYLMSSRINTIIPKIPKLSFINTFFIGGDGSDPEGKGGKFFNGTVDDVRIYSRQLNNDELKYIFSKKSEITNAPIIRWDHPYITYNEVSNKIYTITTCFKSDTTIAKIVILDNGNKIFETTEPVMSKMKKLGCSFMYDKEIELMPGPNKIVVMVTDAKGGTKISTERLIINRIFPDEPKSDRKAPLITLESPNIIPGIKMDVDTPVDQLLITGNVQDDGSIYNIVANGISADYDLKTGNFKVGVQLNEGINSVEIVATDSKQNKGKYSFFVNRAPQEKIKIANLDIADTKERRVALVIGIADYPGVAKLKNPVNDSYAIAEQLKELGFTVISKQDPGRTEMLEAISEYSDSLKKDKNTTGLFYYAGHGMLVKGKNYFVPKDAKYEREADAVSYCIDLESLMENLDESENNMNLIILDACRNNPFAKTRALSGGGLGQVVHQPKGTFISFATAPGQVADDGERKNGLYTQEFLKALKIPKIKLEDVFKRVRIGVSAQTKNEQIPWDNSSLVGDFYFRKK